MKRKQDFINDQRRVSYLAAIYNRVDKTQKTHRCQGGIAF
jgi:hypothetical protein